MYTSSDNKAAGVWHIYKKTSSYEESKRGLTFHGAKSQGNFQGSPEHYKILDTSKYEE